MVPRGSLVPAGLPSSVFAIAVFCLSPASVPSKKTPKVNGVVFAEMIEKLEDLRDYIDDSIEQTGIKL